MHLFLHTFILLKNVWLEHDLCTYFKYALVIECYWIVIETVFFTKWEKQNIIPRPSNESNVVWLEYYLSYLQAVSSKAQLKFWDPCQVPYHEAPWHYLIIHQSFKGHRFFTAEYSITPNFYPPSLFFCRMKYVYIRLKGLSYTWRKATYQ